MEIKEIDDTATRNAKNGPNFLTIVLLFAASILIILVLSYFAFDWYKNRIVPKTSLVSYPALRSDASSHPIQNASADN